MKSLPYENIELTDMKSEIWANVKGYKGRYLVSNYGRVKSIIVKNRHIIMRQNKYGNSQYLTLSFCLGPSVMTKTIHRIVAFAFCKKSIIHTDVNHINGIKLDNRAINLEWVTKSENSIHAFKNGLAIPYAKGKFGKEFYKSKRIVQYDQNGKEVSVYYGAREADRKTGVKYSSITNVCNGKRKTAGGFKWKYS